MANADIKNRHFETRVPCATVRVGEREVCIFMPTEELWKELRELKSMIGQGNSWPLTNFKNLTQAWNLHVLDCVVHHCSDGEFEGPPQDLAGLLSVILKQWDTNFALVATWKGFVLEIAKAWASGIGMFNMFASLALDPHPEVAGLMAGVGQHQAKVALDRARTKVGVQAEVEPQALQTELRSESTFQSSEPEPKTVRGFLGGKALSNALGVHESQSGAFFKQLERMRVHLSDKYWMENSNPQPNTPKFVYLVDSYELQCLAKKYAQPKPT